MNVTYEKTKKKILSWSIEDTIDLFFFSSIIDEYYDYKDFESLTKATYEFINDILEKKLMRAGALLEDNIFIPWDMYINDIIIKIKLEWENLGRELIPHEIVWFEITDKGRKEFEYLNGLPELKETDPFYFDDE